MSDGQLPSEGSKILVESQADLDYLKGLLQHHLGSKLDQSRIDTLKQILESNVQLDRDHEQKQQIELEARNKKLTDSIQQIQREANENESQLIAALTSSVAELIDLCKKPVNQDYPVQSQSPLHEDVFELKNEVVEMKSVIVGKESLSQLNDLLLAC